jgi:hypothetical protein
MICLTADAEHDRMPKQHARIERRTPEVAMAQHEIERLPRGAVDDGRVPCCNF